MKWFWKKEQPKGTTIQEFLATLPEDKREGMRALINDMVDIHIRAYKKGYNEAFKINMIIWGVYLGVIVIISIFKGHVI